MEILRLQVRDLAVVENAEVRFKFGLNVVTGETGAGKSVLIGALALLTGARADHGVIRHGAAQASVTAEIVLSGEAADSIPAILEDAGIDPCENGVLILRRTVSASGGGRCSVNNCPATVGLLAKIGTHLVDMHGPHDNQSLLDRGFQLSAVDAYGHCHAEREKFRSLWKRREALISELKRLSGNTENVEQRIDILKYRIDEIESLSLSEEADGYTLVEEYAAASNSARLIELGSAVVQALSEGENSAIDTMACTARMISEMRSLSAPDAAEWEKEAHSISVQISELSRAVSDCASGFEVSQERMQWLEKRMADVEHIKSKYGKTVGDVLKTLQAAKDELEDLGKIGERAAEAKENIARTESEMAEAGALLTAARKKAAQSLSAAVEEQLAELGLPRAAFSVAFSKGCNENGLDEIEFMFGPNPGDPPSPLRTIASSGEISRVMLAIKTVLSGHDRIPILVFDEIDANVGGEIALSVGRKLRRTGLTHTVICITHLPQVAACGSYHFSVIKKENNGRVSTEINEILGHERENEIARMLGGANLTSVAMEHARELISAGSAQ